jgi:hypothetical protein
LQACEEEQDAGDGEETANVVDLGEDFAVGEAECVDARGRVVEEGREDEADEGPETAEQTDPAPAGVGGDELAPENGRAERDDGEDDWSWRRKSVFSSSDRAITILKWTYG